MTAIVARSRPAPFPIARLLFIGWWIEMAILPLGHVTGLRNTWTVLVLAATFAWLGRDAGRRIPAAAALLALLGWCAASIAWSSVPLVSFGKWQMDLLLPLLAYAAAFGYVRRVGSPAALVGGALTGIGLLVPLSGCILLPDAALLELGRFVRLEAFANVTSPLPVWYPGVGDASMAASLVAVVLLVAPSLLPRVARGWWWAGWIAVVIVVVLANNRNALLAVPAVTVAAWLVLRRSARAPAPDRARAARRRWAVGAGALVVVLALAGILESGARERLRILGTAVPADASALVVLTGRDTRPLIWAHYVGLAKLSPIIGVGFGRTVPGIHYGTQQDRALARVESNAYIHAHNLFINWWLQTGVVGVTLLVVLLLNVIVVARRAWSGGTPGARAAALGIQALVVMMLIRDATDDFLVYGMATLFWASLGALLAVARGGTAPEAPGRPAPVTARRRR